MAVVGGISTEAETSVLPVFQINVFYVGQLATGDVLGYLEELLQGFLVSHGNQNHYSRWRSEQTRADFSKSFVSTPSTPMLPLLDYSDMKKCFQRPYCQLMLLK